MQFEQTYIGAHWSSPFVRWQGELAEMNSLDLAVDVTARALQWRGVDPASLTDIVLGMTVPQEKGFYASTTVAGRIGAPQASGPTISQACATSVACMRTGAGLTEDDDAAVLVVATDRTSNGPVMLYPDPSAMGGAPVVERWVVDNFQYDPASNLPPYRMAEAVAEEGHMERSQLDEVTSMRNEQYAEALKDDRAFQRRFMVPVEVPRGRSTTKVEQDIGTRLSTVDELAALPALDDGGVVTYGNQTHPADATAGMVLVREERARTLSQDGSIVKLLSAGMARVAPGEMPKAPVPAGDRALQSAGLGYDDLDLVTCHTPFAVNDIWFAQQTGVELEGMSTHGCSLVYGHPQAPVGLRSTSELIEALKLRGGGTGMFTGCAAGDTGGAVIVRVEDA